MEEAYAGAARRRIHLATLLHRAAFGHRSGRRRARRVHILPIGLRLTQPQTDGFSAWSSFSDSGKTESDSRE